MAEARPFESIFSGVPKEWREIAQAPLGTVLQLGAGHWLHHFYRDQVEELRVYGAMLDVVFDDYVGNRLNITSWASLHWRSLSESDKPREMVADILKILEANVTALREETLHSGAPGGEWCDWGPCPQCAEKQSYIRLFDGDNLYRCTHCGRWAEYIEETDFNMRRHGSDFDWEKVLPLFDGKFWMSPCRPERACDIIRAKHLGLEVSWLPDRRARQETEERHFMLPSRIEAGDVVPLAEQLFEKLGLSFNPVETIDAEFTHTLAGPSGRKVIWADYKEEVDGFLDAMGGGAFNLQARIEMPPHYIGFEIFASRLVAFRISGPLEEAKRIAEIIKEICV